MGNRSARHAVIALLAVIAAPPMARASDEDEPSEAERTLEVGSSKKGVFSNESPVYYFSGQRGDIVTLTLTGRTVEQMGVSRVVEPAGDWITGHFLDDFASSGNVRKGDSLTLTLRLPETSKYMVFIRDAHFNEEKAPYEISLEGGSSSGPGGVYVRGSITGGLALVDLSPTYGGNVTLAIGKRRNAKLGLEGLFSGTIMGGDTTSVVGLLGIGIRVHNEDSPLDLRFGVGVAGMRGVTDHLGGGVRYDILVKRFNVAFEYDRLGRTNVFLCMVGVML